MMAYVLYGWAATRGRVLFVTASLAPMYYATIAWNIVIHVKGQHNPVSYYMFEYVVPYTMALVDNLHKFTVPNKKALRQTVGPTLVGAGSLVVGFIFLSEVCNLGDATNLA